MRIANPIYDVVFKYLMEDTEIARRFHSKITEEEILRKIEIKEEVESTIEKHIREKQELAEANVELKGENVELKGELSEKDKIIEELRKQLEGKTEKD